MSKKFIPALIAAAAVLVAAPSFAATKLVGEIGFTADNTFVLTAPLAASEHVSPKVGQLSEDGKSVYQGGQVGFVPVVKAGEATLRAAAPTAAERAAIRAAYIN